MRKTMALLSRGALIVFEGLDRSGKSTQSKLLVKNLHEKGYKAEHMVFPDRTTPIGKILSEYLSNKQYDLDDRALHLLFTANRFENVSRIKKLLADKVNVVVDRYSFSGIVFSAIKKGMDINWCKYPESGLPRPDIVYYLNVSLEEMQNRPGFGDERYENQEIQRNVHKEYEILAEEFSFTRIDASKDINTIQNEILEHCVKTIKVIDGTDLKYLDFIGK